MDQPFFYAVDVGRVNLDDLIEAWQPGRIVRVRGSPEDSIKAIPCASVFGQTWKCAYCDSLMAWKLGGIPPRKCTSCGAPRRS